MTIPDVPTRGTYYPAIDGLRTAAVLGVVAFHLSERKVPGAFLSVDVFFVISGFVITLTLLREHDRAGRISLVNFYRRRWWRLMPALVAAVLLGLVLTLVSGHQTLWVWLREAVLGLTYTYNLGQAVRGDGGGTLLNHLWSLSLEEQFYVVWAPALALLLGVLLTRERRVQVLVTAMIVLAIGRSVTALAVGNLSAFFLPWTRFDQFICGALVAVALHGARDAAPRLFTSPWPALGCSAALLALVPATHIFVDDWLYHGGFLAIALATAVIVGHAYVPVASPLKRILSLRPIVWVGERSYGIYLYHLPLILALFTMGAPRWLYGTLAPLGAVLLAAASHRWLETPLRHRGQRPHAAVELPQAPRLDRPAGEAPAPA